MGSWTDWYVDFMTRWQATRDRTLRDWAYASSITRPAAPNNEPRKQP